MKLTLHLSNRGKHEVQLPLELDHLDIRDTDGTHYPFEYEGSTGLLTLRHPLQEGQLIRVGYFYSGQGSFTGWLTCEDGQLCWSNSNGQAGMPAR